MYRAGRRKEACDKGSHLISFQAHQAPAAAKIFKVQIKMSHGFSAILVMLMDIYYVILKDVLLEISLAFSIWVN